MIKLDFVPLCTEWVYSAGDAISAVAVSSQESNKIYIYDGQGSSMPLHVFEKLHTKPVVIMKVRQVIMEDRKEIDKGIMNLSFAV